MSRSYKPIDVSLLKTYSIAQRAHKATIARSAALPQAGASASQLLRALPHYLGAAAFSQVATAMADAYRHDRPVVAAFGAHVIKVGCGPVIIDLMERGILKALACNGACAIHDVELATTGQTSEEVAHTIRDGTFGMVDETLSFFDEAATLAAESGIGLGASVGRKLVKESAPNLSLSVFARAYQLGVPVSVHVALGTDTIHVSPGASGERIGAASLHDFRLICDVVSDLGAVPPDTVGGVWLNIGSAVLLPEVFLKAVAVARNLGADLDAMTTASFDMIRHYRPNQNVVTRPVQPGRGHEIVGHHEIMLPLLRQAVIEQLAERV